MRDTARSSRRRKPRRLGLIPWILLFLAPVAVMVLLLSHAGGKWLDRGAIHSDSAALLPGLTVEATPTQRARPSPPSRLVITSIQSNSPAIRHGIAVGDTVVAIDNARIFSLDQARRSLQKDRADTVALRVAHGREFRDIRLVRARRDHEGERHGPQAARHRR